MPSAPRITVTAPKTRWTPLLERLEGREVPAVTAALSQTVNWTEIGPNVVSNGQVRNVASPNPNDPTTNVGNPVIGAVQALAPHPTGPDLMYAGTPNGGIWRTTNATSTNPTWTPVSDQVSSLSVSDIAYDPLNANRMLVGIGGTADGGELLPTGVVRGDLVGVLYTENAWIDTTTGGFSTPAWRIVGGVLANKNVTKVALRGNIWLVGTDQGLFRSTDNGATFLQVFTSSIDNFNTPGTARAFTGYVFDLAENPGRDNQFYLATGPFGGLGAQVWRSDDFGLTWGAVTQAQMQIGANTTNIQISVRDSFKFTTNLNDNQVYVSVTNTFPPLGAQTSLPGLGAEFAWPGRATVQSSITWSTNQGGTWTRMDNPRQLMAPQGGVGLSDDAATSGILLSMPSEHRLKTGDVIRIQNVFAAPEVPDPPPGDPIYDYYDNFRYFSVRYISPTSVLLTTYGTDTPVPQATAGYDTTRMFWQRVVDTSPGESGQYGENQNGVRAPGLNFSSTGFADVLAAPSNPAFHQPTTAQNILYMGGDMSQFRFTPNNQPGGAPIGAFGDTYPISFTGSFWQGNRKQVPLFTPGSSKQWTSMTDAGAAGPLGNDPSAPGGDTREMVFDAAGNLWVATGTGVYKRTWTRNDALPTGGNFPNTWQNASGNLAIGQFWSVGYDSLNNLAFGSTQDTGMLEQTKANVQAFNAFTSNAVRNSLIDQEYSYSTASDNVSGLVFNPDGTINAAASTTIRYFASSDFSNVVRRVYNSSGTVIGISNLNFANSLTSLDFLSGLHPNDIAPRTATTPSATQDSRNRIIIALNNNDQRRSAFGLTRVYEDSDPFGPATPTGFVVNDVTPAGMTGRVSAMQYGGKRPGNVNGQVNFNQVMYVGTDTGQLWIRDEFGPTFNNRAPGTGAVTSIVLDPDDYRHAFVAQGGRVYETTDGFRTFVDLSNGLVSAPDPTTGSPSGVGLTTSIYALAVFDPNPGTANVGEPGLSKDVVLLAGGRGGVFRRSLSQCNTQVIWSEYGNGLPNTVVTDLEVVTRPVNPNVAPVDNPNDQPVRLVAGTFGRGVWSVNDVRQTLTQTLTLDIIGDNGANSINIVADPNDPNAVLVSDGPNFLGRFLFGQFDRIRVFTQGGADTVWFANAAATGTTLRHINYPVTVDLGGDVGDTLILDARGDARNLQVLVDATTIGAGVGDNLLNSCGSFTYAGLQNGTLTLFTGSGNDNLTFAFGTLPARIVADAGAGNNNFFLNSGVTSDVFLDASGGGFNQAVVSMPAGQAVGVDAPARRMVAGGLTVTAGTGVTNLLLASAGNGSLGWGASAAGDVVYVMRDPLAPGWSQVVRDGFFTRFVNMTNVFVDAQGGADIVRVGSEGPFAGSNTQFVTYTLTVGMGGDSGDILVIDAPAGPGGRVTTVTPTTIGNNPGDNLFGPGGRMGYTGLTANGLLTMNIGGGDSLTWLDANVLPLVLVNATGANNTVNALGTAGNDTFTVAGQGLTANNLRATTTGVQLFGAYGQGGTDSLTALSLSTFGTDNLGILQTAALNGVVSGLPIPAAYVGVANVNVDGGGGLNNLGWIDLTNLSWGAASNPAAGLVYAPTGPVSGQLTLGNGAGTTTRFNNINGAFSLNGDGNGTNTRDVVSVLGVSTIGLAQYGEATSTNGSDIIVANDFGVTISNTALGALRSVLFAFQPGGASTFSTTLIRTGNEVGTGDTVTAAATTRTNLLVDGGAPSSLPGDTINVLTNGPSSTTQTSNPIFGPPQTRITSRSDQSAVGFWEFENVLLNGVGGGSGGLPPSPPPVPSNLFAVGTDAGVPALVNVYNLDGSLRFTLAPLGGFTGGVRVAVGDVTGDGQSDVVVGAGPGGGPAVQVYDGPTGRLVRNFFAYDPGFRGGVTVAVGLFNSDQAADIVTGAGSGGGPHVKVFDGRSLEELQSFFAYAPSMSSGVNVAAGDVNADGVADVITGPMAGPPNVRVFNGSNAALIRDFLAFSPGFTGGVFVAAGDFNGDSKADIVAGAGSGGGPAVQVFDSNGLTVLASFFANDPTTPGAPPISSTTGVRVAASDFDGDGKAEVLLGGGAGNRPIANVAEIFPFTSILSVNAFGDGYSNGIFVGA